MIKLIAALDSRGGIGINGKLPWYFPEDLKRFASLTIGSFVLMGRKTFDSLSKPLAHRTSIVVTRKKLQNVRGKFFKTCFVPSIEVGLKFCDNDVWVIGGQQIYEQTINLAQELFLTRIDREYECDTFFPAIPSKFKLESTETHSGFSYEHWTSS